MRNFVSDPFSHILFYITVIGLLGGAYVGRVRDYTPNAYVLLPDYYCCYVQTSDQRVASLEFCGELFSRGSHYQPLGGTYAFFEPLSIKECNEALPKQEAFFKGGRLGDWMMFGALLSSILLLLRYSVLKSRKRAPEK